MSKKPKVSISGNSNLTANQFLENDLDFLAMMGYTDTDFNQTGKNINQGFAQNLANFTYTNLANFT